MKAMVRGLVLLAAATVVSAQTPDDWRNWRYSAAISIPAPSADGLVSVELPALVTARSRPDWADVRVIDAHDREMPFVLHALFGGDTFNRRPVPVLEPTIVEGQYRQVILDAGQSRSVHNALRLSISTDRSLLAFVEIAVSEDLKDWRVIRARAPIYALRADGKGQNTDVSYPDSESRYIRVRVLEGSSNYTIGVPELGYKSSAPAERAESGATLTPSTNAYGQSVWLSSRATDSMPMARVGFQTAQRGFSRPVTVETSTDGKRWRLTATGEIRVSDDESLPPALTVDFPDTLAPFWRITVSNGNDAAIGDLVPALLTVPRHVVWRPVPGESYRLIFGNPRATAPSYDLAQRTSGPALDRATSGRLEAAQESANWIDPTPWTERHAWVLWIALIAAVLTLGIVSVRTLRSSASADVVAGVKAKS